MEDTVSIKSSDSVTTSGEYEIVSELIDCPTATATSGINVQATTAAAAAAGTASTSASGAAGQSQSPTLRIANNGDFRELEKNLHEVIHEMDISGQASQMLPEAAPQIVATVSPHEPRVQGMCKRIVLVLLIANTLLHAYSTSLTL